MPHCARRSLARLAIPLLVALAAAHPAAAAPQCPPDAFEPNEDCGAAPLIGVGTLAGLTSAPGDIDYFATDVPAGQRLEVRLTFASPGASLGGSLSLIRDDGSALPCDDFANTVASLWFAAGQPNPLLVAWSAPATATERFIIELRNFSTECGTYDLDVAIVPDPCASLPPDALEDNDDCASAVLLAPGSFAGLNVGIQDRDFYAVQAAPGELITVTVSGAPVGETLTALAWEQGPNCGDTNKIAAGTTVFGNIPAGFYLYNPGPGLRTFVFEVSPNPNQSTQSGFCVDYALAVDLEFNPCDLLSGDPFEPNSDCATAPLLSSSQTGLKLHAGADQDWYTLDVPARSTVRVLSESTSSQLSRRMMLFSGCGGSVGEFLASSNSPLFNSSDPRQWLEWSNASDFAVSTRLFMLPIANNAPSTPFCDIYNLDLEFTLGAPYCIPTANSTGDAARLTASGSTSVGAGVLELDAAPVPANVLGLVFFGPAQKAPTAFGGGWLCTQGPLLRLPAASTGAGVLHTQIDWSGTAAVIGAGQSWSFQAWFRDPSTPKAFNVSEGLELGFQ